MEAGRDGLAPCIGVILQTLHIGFPEGRLSRHLYFCQLFRMNILTYGLLLFPFTGHGWIRLLLAQGVSIVLLTPLIITNCATAASVEFVNTILHQFFEKMRQPISVLRTSKLSKDAIPKDGSADSTTSHNAKGQYNDPNLSSGHFMKGTVGSDDQIQPCTIIGRSEASPGDKSAYVSSAHTMSVLSILDNILTRRKNIS
jgi:hypothetical protein